MLRVNAYTEEVGMDISAHKGAAYGGPDSEKYHSFHGKTISASRQLVFKKTGDMGNVKALGNLLRLISEFFIFVEYLGG
jgi:hypothetical protein